MRYRCFVVVALIATGGCQSRKVHVVVSAGATERQDTPVFVDVDLPPGAMPTSASVTCSGRAAAAQIEDLGAGRGRAWWVVDHLPAGQTRVCTVHSGQVPADPASRFTWRDSSGEHGASMDLLFGDRPVVRYMCAPFDPNDIERTKKPFHHVFAPDGSRLLTNGAGGLFPHHRGIFFGYNKCEVAGDVYDTWHAAKGEHQVHREVLREMAGPILGGHEVRIDWNDREGKAFATEVRRLVAYRQPAGQLLIEFSSTLRATGGPVRLWGDRQHAGVQWRAAQEVAEHQEQTRYLRPAAWADLPPDKEINTPEHKDLPWNAVQYALGDQRYTVAWLSDPANPDNAEFSERLYGRFGEYFPWELRDDNPLTVRYRWWICDTDQVAREQIERKHQDLAGPPGVAVQ